MTFDPFGYNSQFAAINKQLATIIALLQQLLAQEVKMAHTLEEVLADVADEGTKEDGLVTLVKGLADQVKVLLAAVPSIPADVQAKIDAVFASVEANKTKVQAALDANTPAVAAKP
jgi:hypothetical protein